MKDFEWKFFEVIRKEMVVRGKKYEEKIPVFTLSKQSSWRKKGHSVSYISFKFFMSWPFSLGLHADLAIYHEQAYLFRHTDISKHLLGNEYRAILILRNAEKGGEIRSDKFVFNSPRIKIINTSIPHEVTKIERGERLVLLFGLYIAPFHNTKPQI